MTATATQPSPKLQAPMKPRFQMPRPLLGDRVIWYQDRKEVGGPEATPQAAIVTEVGSDQISLGIVYPGAAAIRPLSGVRHASDPNTESIDAVGLGVWDFAKASDLEEGDQRANIKNQLAALTVRVNELVRTVESLTKKA